MPFKNVTFPLAFCRYYMLLLSFIIVYRFSIWLVLYSLYFIHQYLYGDTMMLNNIFHVYDCLWTLLPVRRFQARVAVQLTVYTEEQSNALIQF